MMKSMIYTWYQSKTHAILSKTMHFKKMYSFRMSFLDWLQKQTMNFIIFVKKIKIKT